MNTKQYRPPTIENRDRMPREVAVSLLTNPKGKLSARMRKNCREALQLVIPSEYPVEHAHGMLQYRTDLSGKPIDESLAKKFSSVEIGRLQRVVIRCNRRLKKVMKAFQTCKVTQVKLGLIQLAERLKLAQECAVKELGHRQSRIESVPEHTGQINELRRYYFGF